MHEVRKSVTKGLTEANLRTPKLAKIPAIGPALRKKRIELRLCVLGFGHAVPAPQHRSVTRSEGCSGEAEPVNHNRSLVQ
jgi:hypothetical protein